LFGCSVVRLFGCSVVRLLRGATRPCCVHAALNMPPPPPWCFVSLSSVPLLALTFCGCAAVCPGRVCRPHTFSGSSTFSGECPMHVEVHPNRPQSQDRGCPLDNDVGYWNHRYRLKFYQWGGIRRFAFSLLSLSFLSSCLSFLSSCLSCPSWALFSLFLVFSFSLFLSFFLFLFLSLFLSFFLSLFLSLFFLAFLN